jgi:type IV pilus assembly protein PilX
VRSQKQRHRGAAMIVVLFLLMAMALTGMSALRVSMGTHAQASNLVAHTQAREAAQGALRWCEGALLEEASAVLILPAPPAGAPAAWQVPANWAGGRAHVVSVAGVGEGRPPQCLAEFQAAGGSGQQVVLVTARGFSADHVQDERGLAISGASVWLQSVVSLVAP